MAHDVCHETVPERSADQPQVISGRDVAMGWILLAMATFGLLVALAFPLLTERFVVWRPGERAWFRVACIVAGLAVSGFSYALVRFTLYKTNQRLAHLAAYDMLTGLANQRQFFRQLRTELCRSARLAAPVSLIIADIDHFKLVNDTRGHLVGNEVLAAVARQLAAAVRPFDTVCRIGGEEFAVILPQTTKKQALAVAERIRARVACTEHDTLPCVTVSLGVAAYPEDADSLRTLVKRADDAMYLAKEAGRNTARAWTPSAAPALA